MMNKLQQITQAKSDQLNADDLLVDSKTITVTNVTLNDPTKPQPVIINYQGDNGRPYKPCKGMTRVICAIWGAAEEGREWIGKSMTLYRNPDVIFSGEKVGGIEISHMSHLKNPSEDVPVTIRKGKKRIVKIKRLDVSAHNPSQQPAAAITEQDMAAYKQWAEWAINSGITTSDVAITAVSEQGLILPTDQHKQAFTAAFNAELSK